MSRIVISDASPLRYLILIGAADVLSALYAEILLPQAVADELRHSSTPEPVRKWLANAPPWLRVTAVVSDDEVALRTLDRGECEAILLALQVKADLLLMDERDGVEQARRLGLAVTGTLGVLDLAAEHGLIDLSAAFVRLRETNFRVNPVLLDRLLEADSLRRKK